MNRLKKHERPKDGKRKRNDKSKHTPKAVKRKKKQLKQLSKKLKK